MARKAKTETNGHGVSAIRGNGYEKGAVNDFVSRIEEVQGEIDEIMLNAREKCDPKREDIDAIKEEATEAGIPRRELNAVISKRRMLKKAEAVRDRLSKEQQDNFDQLEQALGMFKDTPLGSAALAAAAPDGSGATA